MVRTLAPRPDQAPIDSYAAIGDGRSVALVGCDGSIDWLAWPSFDSPPVFAALLDAGRGGRFVLRPIDVWTTERSYVEGTNVLATRFTTRSGAVTVFDFMPLTDTPCLRPTHGLARCIRCDDGEVEMEAELEITDAFQGSKRARLVDRGAIGAQVETAGGILTARADWRSIIDGGVVRGRVSLRRGERASIVLAYDEQAPAALPLVGQEPWLALEETIALWRRWFQRGSFGSVSDARRGVVERSALALKLLVHAPSGSIVAAPTTSLPECIGGDANWDYRYCWLRDASMTVRALLGLGFEAEAEAFVDWMLHATRLSFPDLHILYDVYGNPPQPERSIDTVSGYRGSLPVRVGNAARSQLQLDVFGEVIDAASQLAVRRNRLDRDASAFLVGLGRRVCARWREPDQGIWEPRGAPAAHTHSRLLCWVALDRLLDLDRRGLVRLPGRADFERHHRDVREDIESHAFSERLSSYVGTLGGDDLDATALLIPYYGFDAAGSPRMRGTYGAVRRELSAGRGLLRRNLDLDEGAFGICGFWGVEFLARGGGDLAEAERAFASLAAFANDVGLFGEETDPATGAALGNFPQAFTHVGIISAALAIEQRRAEVHACSAS